MESQRRGLRATASGRMVAKIIWIENLYAAKFKSLCGFMLIRGQPAGAMERIALAKVTEQAKLTVFGAARRRNESGGHGRSGISGVHLCDGCWRRAGKFWRWTA